MPVFVPCATLPCVLPPACLCPKHHTTPSSWRARCQSLALPRHRFVRARWRERHHPRPRFVAVGGFACANQRPQGQHLWQAQFLRPRVHTTCAPLCAGQALRSRPHRLRRRTVHRRWQKATSYRVRTVCRVERGRHLGACFLFLLVLVVTTIVAAVPLLCRVGGLLSRRVVYMWWAWVLGSVHTGSTPAGTRLSFLEQLALPSLCWVK